jgi:hypothetical protein
MRPPNRGEIVDELQFHLLGPFQVWRGDARLDASLSGQPTRELRAFLRVVASIKASR